MNDDRRKLGYQMLRLTKACYELDKKTRNYGTDVPIFFSEIHIISAIAEHPGIHVSGLAELQGITKGSVSEIIQKLEKKALVKKEADEDNLSKLSLRLTEKGRKAHKGHMRYHAMLDKLVETELQFATEDDIRLLSNFFSSVIESVERCSENFNDDLWECCDYNNFDSV
jgi:DNA-binding MarR family transcriptional regulator